jgi:hypothetical protein
MRMITAEMEAFNRLKDYEMENWLYSLSKNREKSSCDCPTWQQLAQYSVYHTINEWYSIPHRSRTSAVLGQIFARRWFHKIKRFRSPAHYDFVRKSLIKYLQRELLPSAPLVIPHLLFESIEIHSKSLGIDTSMIFHVLEPGSESFVIRKFVVDSCPQVAEAYFHMSIVFSEEAFGELPERVEVIDLLHGSRQMHIPRQEKVMKSKDYMHMMKELFFESQSVCEEERKDEIYQ